MNISTLKAHLSAAIRRVKAGERIVVLDRNLPVAELVAPQTTARIKIRPQLKKMRRLPVSSAVIKVDLVAMLREERDRR